MTVTASGATTLHVYYASDSSTAVDYTLEEGENTVNLDSKELYSVSAEDTSLITAIDFNGCNVSHCANLFYGWTGLTSVKNLKTEGCTSHYCMFRGCTALSEVDADQLDFSSSTIISNLFYGCISLAGTFDASSWEVGKAENANSVFNGCTGITSLDCSGWDTSRMTGPQYIFSYMTRLTTLSIGSSWGVSGMTAYANWFTNDSKLTTICCNGASEAVREWFISRLSDAGFTFTYDSGTDTLTKTT